MGSYERPNKQSVTSVVTIDIKINIYIGRGMYIVGHCIYLCVENDQSWATS